MMFFSKPLGTQQREEQVHADPDGNDE